MSTNTDANETMGAVVSLDEQSIPVPKRAKRSRVQVACQRCQTRKQKVFFLVVQMHWILFRCNLFYSINAILPCLNSVWIIYCVRANLSKCDGTRPECSTCVSHGLECRYVLPSYHKPQEAKMYIKALENRVAELETTLTNGGLVDAALDHWHQRAPRVKKEKDGPEAYSPLAAVRDVSLNTSGSFIGGTSTLTLARMLESILGCNGKEQTAQQTRVSRITSPDTNSPNAITSGETSPEYRETSTSNDLACESRSFPGASWGMQTNMADKLLLAYFKHVAVNFPVVHSAQIKDIHQRRDALDDPYEESILNLVYALGGQFLETVGLVLGL